MKLLLSTAAVAVIVFSTCALSARASIVAAGDDIKLYDGLGTSGGIFHVDVLGSGASTSPYDFDTFCVQTKEFISFSPTYRVLSIGKNVLGSDSSHQNNVALSSFAAWLYSGFLGVDGVSLASTGFNVNTLSHVNTLQAGIWTSLGYTSLFTPDAALLTSLTNLYNSDMTWAAQTADINGNKTGNVKIMNLVTLNANGVGIKTHHQDQLVWIPTSPPPPPVVPEPLSVVVWSLLAMCAGSVIARRTR